jgi:hypothetical protein
VKLGKNRVLGCRTKLRELATRSPVLAATALIACGVVTNPSGLRAFGQEGAEVNVRVTEGALTKAIARKDRLRGDLHKLKASTAIDEGCNGLSPHQVASAAEQIRRLEYNLQSARASVASLELERAEAIVGIVPDAISRYEMTRLKCHKRIEKLLLERMRLVAEKQSSLARNRLEEIELSIAEQRLRIAKADLDETSRFPPGAIAEGEYHQLREEAREARLRLENLQLSRQKRKP